MSASTVWVPCLSPQLCGVKKHKSDTASLCNATKTRSYENGAEYMSHMHPPKPMNTWADRNRLIEITTLIQGKFTLHDGAKGVLQTSNITKVNIEYKDGTIVLSRGGEVAIVDESSYAENTGRAIIQDDIIKAYDGLVERHPNQDWDEFPEQVSQNPLTRRPVATDKSSAWTRLRRAVTGK